MAFIPKFVRKSFNLSLTYIQNVTFPQAAVLGSMIDSCNITISLLGLYTVFSVSMISSSI